MEKAQWEEPEVLATFDRAFGDKKEQLRFERGQFKGKPTYTLRVYWQTPEGQWRWSAARLSESGKTWQAFSIKAKELHALGEALIRAAADASDTTGQKARRSVKDTPERKAARDRFDQYHRGERDDERDSDIPF